MRYFLILLFILSIGFSYAQQPCSYQLNTSNGLISNTVYNVLQDSKGYYWFATEAGIARYDGKRFKNFTKNDGLGDNINFGVFEDSKNRIWFSGYNGTVSLYENGRWFNSKNTAWLENLNSSRFYEIINEGKSGTIYFSNRHGEIAIVLTNETQKFDVADQLIKKSAAVLGIFEYDGNKKTVQTSLGKYDFDNGKLGQIEHSDVRYSYMKIINDGVMLVDQNSIIYKYSFSGELSESINTLQGKEIKFSINTKNILFAKPKGNGVYQLTKFENEYRTTKFLESTVVSDCIEDNEGNLFFSTLGDGVFVVHSMNNYHIDKASGLKTEKLLTIYPTANDEVLIGDENSSYNVFSGDQFIKSVLLPVSDKYNRVLDINEVDGKIFIGTDRGIFLVKDNKIEKLINVSAIKFLVHNESAVFAGTIKGVQRIDRNTGKVLDTISRNRSFAGLAMEDGTIMYSEKGAINIYSNGETEKYTHSDKLKDYRVVEIEKIGETFIFGTEGDGLFIVSNDSIIELNTESGLSSNFVTSICEINNNNVLIGTRFGMNEIDLNSYSINIISKRNGLPSDYINDIKEIINKIYVTTDNGLAIINNLGIQVNNYNKVIFEEVQLTDSTLLVTTENYFEVDNRHNNISVQYSFPVFTDANDLKYSYKFYGEDKESELASTTNEDILQFVSLKPGNYSLSVTPLIKSQLISESTATMSFAIIPLWYQKTSVQIIALIAALLLLAFLIYHFLNRASKKHKEQLELNKKIFKLEMDGLKAQMNPHFTYNVLNAVQNLVLKKDSKQAYNYITKFSRLMRNYLDSTRSNFIKLSEEIELISNYVQLEQLRLDNKFDFELNVADNVNLENITIPSMIVQPFIENAIHHGLLHKDGKGKLKVGIEQQNGTLQIAISDDGIGREKAGIINSNKTKMHKSYGVQIIKERIALFEEYYKRKIEIIIKDLNENNVPSGTNVHLTIGLRK
ncbi:MAG: histidine kinase [Bacteroidia bacterium]|nr:histidine kinase [Bacteroidia bacterium]